MSYTEIFAVRENGDITKYGEAHNAFGGAMHIWMYLKEKYQVQDASVFDFGPLWKKVEELQETDRWVLMSTFDRVLISKEHLPTLIKHLKTFAGYAPTPTLKEEIAILERAARDESIQAVGFNQTSVIADMWLVPVSEEEEMETGYSTRAYNIHKDKGHWYLEPKKEQKR